MQKLMVLMALVACGKQDEAPAQQAAGQPAPAESKPAEAAKPADKPAEAAKPADDKPLDTSNGWCKVKLSGGLDMEDTGAHTGSSTLMVNDWLTPERRKASGFADGAIIINCLGKQIRYNILTTNKVPVPTKPAKYDLDAKPRAFTLMGTVGKGKDSIVLGDVKGGTLEITAFDDTHIAGTITGSVRTLPDKGDVKLEVTFDMKKL